MRIRAGVTFKLLIAALAAWPAAAAAEPVKFAHGTVDQNWMTTQPGTTLGSTFKGRYHAAGNPDEYPPYMRSMTFRLAPGMRYDTSVPERCTATDLELAASSGACPPGSKLAEGKVEAAFMGRFPTTVDVETFNAEDQQLMIVRSPFLVTIVRARISPDGATIEFRSPTCYPSTPAGCPVDNVLQLGSDVVFPPYSRTVNGALRSYVATPPKCPKSGSWQTTIDFQWADGSADKVTSRHPCKRPKPKQRKRRPARSR